MAVKKITKANTYNITLNVKSKDTVYQFKNQTVAASAYLNFTLSGSTDWQYARKGNDLIIFAEFGSSNNYTPVLTTVKDYFKYAWNYNHDLVSINSSSIYGSGAIYNLTNRFAKGSIIDDFSPLTYIGDRGKTTYNIKRSSGNMIYETAGNDIYNLRNNSTIYDYSGKDKYNISKSAHIPTLLDFKGNDEYSFTSDHFSNVHDYKGNDKYTFTNAVMVTDDGDPNPNRIHDYNGNDSYKITKSKGVYIIEDKGNDKYVINNCVDLLNAGITQNIYINDRLGNDKYNISNVSYTSSSTSYNINDEKGKDSYNLNGVKYMTVHDIAGKDSYIISSSNNITVHEIYSATSDNDSYKISDSSNIAVNENGGNDKYFLSAANNSTITDTNGDDKYNVSKESKIVMIEDIKGKDIYNFSETVSSQITDSEGNDKYNIKNSDNFIVSDSAGDDVYNYKNNFSQSISGYSSSITDNDGKDKYNITSSELEITDSDKDDTYTLNSIVSVKINDTNISSNDTYKVSKLSGRTSITDAGGDKDKLIFSKAKANNIVYLADFTTNNDIGSTNLYILDKKGEGIVEIKDYFDVAGKSITTTTGVGKIESVKAGKTELVSKIDNFYSTSTNYSQLASDIASWLSTNTGFSNIGNLFEGGSETQIQDFIVYFSK